MYIKSQPNIPNAPVLFIIFNRPETTKQVFAAIREYRPQRLYIASDGPRDYVADDIEKVKLTREIVERIDWQCEVFTKFEKKNLGCGYGVSSAISWVFQNEDRAIILEDDCVPSQSFFYFCNELLEKYLYDERIWFISGSNFYEEIDLPYSYIFSRYGHIWGWATWARVWQYFDIEMKNLELFFKLGGFKNVFLNKKESRYFDKKYSKFIGNKSYINYTWDYQFDFIFKSNYGLSIIPQKNLIKNIGIVGTHSADEGKFHNRNVDDLFKIENHPIFISPYYKYEKYSFYKHYYNKIKIKNKIKRKISKIFKNIIKK